MPYLSDATIEAEAAALLARHARKTGATGTVPARLLDDLVQHLGLQLEIYDLRAELGAHDVLGAIYLEQQLIRIDESLDPDEYPAMRGRFNFSLAHEIGHWCLHRGDVELRQQVDDLFGGPAEPSIICRSSRKRASIEIQADLFASCLLMPREQLVPCWQRRIGHAPLDLGELGSAWPKLVATAGVRRGAIPGNPREQQDSVIELIIKPLADEFHVSAQAMRIRLERMGMIVRNGGAMVPLFEGL